MGIERLPKVEFYDFYYSPNIRLVKSRRMKCGGYVTRIRRG